MRRDVSHGAVTRPSHLLINKSQNFLYIMPTETRSGYSERRRRPLQLRAYITGHECERHVQMCAERHRDRMTVLCSLLPFWVISSMKAGWVSHPAQPVNAGKMEMSKASHCSDSIVLCSQWAESHSAAPDVHSHSVHLLKPNLFHFSPHSAQISQTKLQYFSFFTNANLKSIISCTAWHFLWAKVRNPVRKWINVDL